MSKPFFEVFPTLKVQKDLKSFFEETRVERLTSNHERTRLKVSLRSDHLIHKSRIYRMQDEISGQLFTERRVQVYLDEHFDLSAQYTPRQLMETYFDSLVCEVSSFSPVMGKFLRDSEVSYPEDQEIRITMEDSCLSQQMYEKLEEALDRIFRDRCGVPARIHILLEKREKKKDRRTAGAGSRLFDVPVSGAAGPAGAIPAAGTGSAAGIPSGTGSGMSGQEAPAAAAEPMPWEEGPAPAAADGTAAVNGTAAAGGKAAGNGKAAANAAAAADRTAGAAARGTKSPDAAAQGAGGRRLDFRKRESKYTTDRRNGRNGRNEKRGRRIKFSNHPDLIYGREVNETAIQIADLIGENQEVVLRGQILNVDFREIRGERNIVKFCLTDFTDSIYCKIFIANEFVGEIKGALKKGAFVKVKGVTQQDTFEHELTIGSVAGIMSIPSFVEKRKDTAEEKRVELHLHTKMSDMDGVSECKDLVKRAYAWGMPAIAVTDHGNVQSFPDANHVREDLLSAENKKRKEAGLPPVDPQKFFKVIYGVECYLVDDLKRSVTYGSHERPEDTLSGHNYVVFDLETTGFSPVKNKIIEIGAVKIENGQITGRFSEFVNPQIPIPYRITQLTSIRDDMVINADPIEKVLPRFLEFCRGFVLVGHNVGFDIGFIDENARQQGLESDFTTIDTEQIARVLLPGHARYTLDAVAKQLNVNLGFHHRAVDDAECTAGIFFKETQMLQDREIESYQDINALSDSNPELVKRLHPYHCVLLAKNDTGKVNLYRMISDSHLKYFFKKPRIPKSELIKHREGILVGSACVAGELFQAVLEQRSPERIAKIVEFYDYLEIQPRGNNAFLLEEKSRKRYPEIQTMEDVLDLNRQIVRLGEEFNKPVVATGDVHFMDPEDEIYRTIIQDGMGMNQEEDPAPLYFHTTDEMLEEFSYLGARKAREVVIDNTRRIADMIEVLSPVRPDKCAPVIPHSDETLRQICYDKAHSMYGDPLPPIVEERLERELGSIISNGYSVMYIIAQKLVWKSVEDGYLVGSRGSVGSSFVATMSGITEVNPLAPHYYCTECHYSDFDSPEVLAYQGKCGIDMPRKMCPRCGAELKKDGFDIPFETFLGFKGDKEPDIDLNFSGEYQSKAHKYTEVIFGHGQTYKAGTIATVADKTAYGYVKNYFERKEIHKRNSEIERLLQGCTGIRRSTGQHPGGIVVLPLGEEINTFTPVQHPANDMTTDIVTTHFDYHSIDHNLLKLDILGHDDPTMVRMLQDLTGIDPLTIPLDDPETMSIFSSTEALGITTEQNGGIDVGSLGVPEFGTKFVMGMLDDTRPTTMSELVRISGLSHGTDVWLGNAQTLIQEGKATLSTAICTRDDIMSYLIAMGVEKSMAFKTMESVRKGKGLKPEMREAMEAAGVPQWYIDSCLKIKYMFPRAHAAAYVMMALRIAYCKVHHPLAYYAAYFSIRANAFSYELMCQGQEHLLEEFERLKKLEKPTPKDQATMDDMCLVREFYARGFTFTPIDIFQAASRNCKIVDGRIMPALTSIDGMGEKAADAVVEAAKDGPFLSRDDFWNRTKVPKTVVEKMFEMGLLGDLPETNQISIFDFMGM